MVLPYFWMPEDSLDLRVRRDHVPYDVWERQGHLQTTEGNVVHYGYIEKLPFRKGVPSAYFPNSGEYLYISWFFGQFEQLLGIFSNLNVFSTCARFDSFNLS